MQPPSITTRSRNLPKNSPHRFALTPPFIEYIHDFLVTEWIPGNEPVGSKEARDWGLLDSAASRPFQSFSGEEVYPHLFQKGAALFHSLIANHPFHNGNKRTAVIALDLFLIANGWLLTLSGQGMYDLAKATASYRQHGISHEDQLSRIADTIRLDMISFARLRKSEGESNRYKALLTFRRGISS